MRFCGSVFLSHEGVHFRFAYLHSMKLGQVCPKVAAGGEWPSVWAVGASEADVDLKMPPLDVGQSCGLLSGLPSLMT